VKPTPPHHKTIEIPAGLVRNGYGGVRLLGVKAYIIVAAAPVDAKDPPRLGMVRVIVAPHTRGDGT
jgi:hypothetical protein